MELIVTLAIWVAAFAVASIITVMVLRSERSKPPHVPTSEERHAEQAERDRRYPANPGHWNSGPMASPDSPRDPGRE